MLYEDRYETVCGDGFYVYFATACLSRRVADAFIEAHARSYVAHHLVEWRLEREAPGAWKVVAKTGPGDVSEAAVSAALPRYVSVDAVTWSDSLDGLEYLVLPSPRGSTA